MNHQEHNSQQLSILFSYAPKWYEKIKENIHKYSEFNIDLSKHDLIIHNATWCPDCERETIEILSLVHAIGKRAPKLTVVHYQDIKKYKEEKALKTLPIGCLPTIILERDGTQIFKIEERSNTPLFEMFNRSINLRR